MYAVDVFLLFVVTFSVILFFIVDSSRKDEQIESVSESVLRATADDDVDDDDDGDGEEQSMVCESDDERIEDWEGIETSELEKKFGESVVFVSCKKNGDEIDEDVKSELYALQNLVLQGPASHASQPFLFNLSARANWNAWQKLGNMSRESAMEKYIDILAKTIPQWKVEQNDRDPLLHLWEGVGTNNEATSSED